jgi:hypothetical protein
MQVYCGWYVEHPQIAGTKLYYQRSYPVKTGVYNGNHGN